MVGRVYQTGRHRYTRFVGGPNGPFVRPISEIEVDVSGFAPAIKGQKKPAPYVTKTPMVGGSLIFSFNFRERECTTAEFNALNLVGRLEGSGYALTAHCWTHLKLAEPRTEEEVRDALLGRIKGDYHLSDAVKVDIFGNRETEQTVSFQFADDLIFGKMALFG